MIQLSFWFDRHKVRLAYIFKCLQANTNEINRDIHLAYTLF